MAPMTRARSTSEGVLTDAVLVASTKAFVILDGALLPTTACPRTGIVDALAAADIKCWADKAYQGAGRTVRTPYWGRWETLSTGQKAVNRAHTKIRALVEQAMAALKARRLLRRLRCSTTRTTSLVQAPLARHLAGSE